MRVGMTNPPYMLEHLPAICELLHHPNPSPSPNPNPNPNPSPNPNQVALLEQEYIVEDKAGDVSQVLKKASEDLGAEVTPEG